MFFSKLVTKSFASSPKLKGVCRTTSPDAWSNSSSSLWFTNLCSQCSLNPYVCSIWVSLHCNVYLPTSFCIPHLPLLSWSLSVLEVHGSCEDLLLSLVSILSPSVFSFSVLSHPSAWDPSGVLLTCATFVWLIARPTNNAVYILREGRSKHDWNKCFHMQFESNLDKEDAKRR